MSVSIRRMLSGFVCSLVAVCCASAVVADGPKALASAKTSSAKIVRNFGNLPLSFEPNRGQSDPRVKFIARAHNETLFLTQNGATIALTRQGLTPAPSTRSGSVVAGIRNAAFRVPPRLESSAVRMEFVGASGSAKIEGVGRNAGVTNYFVGADSKKWHANIPNYSKVRYTGLYRGVDLLFYGDANHFEYDLIVAPGANPRAVQFRFDGASKIGIDKAGDLAIAANDDQVVLRKPVVYQERAGKRTRIDGHYILLDRSIVAFEVGSYDRNSQLVIDPSLTWAKILPGNFLDITNAVATDSSNNPYVTGFTCSSDFEGNDGPTFVASTRAGCDAFVTKRNADGSPAYTSIFGGSAFEQGFGIAVDGTGAAYVAGQTFSIDFSHAPAQKAASAAYDAFVVKLDPSGQLSWAKILGGSHPTEPFLGLGWSIGFSVAIPMGCQDTCPAYVVGQTTVTDFPNPTGPTSGAVQNTALNDFDAFLTEISPAGDQVVYSTYFSGGPDSRNVGTASWAYGVAVDAAGKAYLDGGSHIASLPVTAGFSDPYAAWAGAGDCWAAKIDTTSATPVYSRFLGGADHDECRAIAIEPGCAGSCAAYLTGVTWSSDFPHTANAYQQTFGGYSDAFVTKLDSGGSLAYSTFLGNVTGENGSSISVDSAGEAYVTGTTGNFFPQANPVQGPIPRTGNLLVSGDGGASFSATNFPASAGLVSDIELDANTGEIFVGSFETGVQRSGDGGATWSPFGTANTLGMVPDPNDTSLFFGGGFNGLFRSTDGGGTFIPTQITDELSTVPALDGNNLPSTVYAGTGVDARSGNMTGRVYKSIDSGVTFMQMAGLNATTIFSVAVDPNDATVYAGTSRGLYHTSNFQLTGSMSVGRQGQTTTLLPDGTALVVGGQSMDVGSVLYSSAEIYSPNAGTFAATAGSMITGRSFHTATLLSDGTGDVLITGGCGTSGAAKSAELYHYVTKTFEQVASMKNNRCGHTATLLPNGTVLVAGGDVGANGTAEIYDPVSKSFGAQAFSLTTARKNHTASLLPDGSVLLAGGDSAGTTTATAERCSAGPLPSCIATSTPMNTARKDQVATLTSGDVLIAGGSANDGTALADAELYHPLTDQFETIGSMDQARTVARGVTLADGRFMIIGGASQNGSPLNAEIYDGGFSLAGPLNHSRVSGSAVTLADGRVLIEGGNNGPGQVSEASAELFDGNSVGFQLTAYRSDPVFQVAVDANNFPSIVYAAVAQGVARSSDGFNNFSFIDFLGGGTFYSLALDNSSSPAILYAGDNNGELVSSTDTGDHVLVQNIHGSKPGNVTALASPSDGTTVYATVNDEFDAFVTKLDANGQNLLFSSFIGGSQGDFSNGIALAPDGSAYVTGGTGSGDFNSAAGQLEGRDNPFIAKIPNTLAGSGQTDCISLRTCITFPTVVSGGNTVATTSATGPQLPPGLSLVTNTSITNITTTATIMASDSFPITVCFAYDPANVTNPANLSLMHFENGQWINVTTKVDTMVNIICGGVTSLSPFAVVIGKPVTVMIQIKPPSSAPVPINLSSGGVVPVAILSTSTFDATKVIPSSIVIDGAKVNLKGKGTYQCSSQDVNGDHRADLVCQVTTNQIDLIPGSALAILTATTTSGTPIQGQEAINVVKQ